MVSGTWSSVLGLKPMPAAKVNYLNLSADKYQIRNQPKPSLAVQCFDIDKNVTFKNLSYSIIVIV